MKVTHPSITYHPISIIQLPNRGIKRGVNVIRIWRQFRKALDKQDRKKFDEMLCYSRLYNAAGSMACRPVLIQVILMSIIFEHYKQLRKIVNERIRSCSK
jgi:hypothetical protein